MTPEMTYEERARAEFDALNEAFTPVAERWKSDWLKKNPPTELVIHLNDPVGNTARRQRAWQQHFDTLTIQWWAEHGWAVEILSDGCRFTPPTQTNGPPA